MTRISDPSTALTKRVVPAFWFGMIGLVAYFLFVVAADDGIVELLHVALLVVVLTVFAYVVMRWLVFDLVDEAWDCRDSLLVRNRGDEERIPLTECINVSYLAASRLPRITVTVRRETRFGTEIAFVPPPRLFAFFTHPIATDLIKRIDEARSASESNVVESLRDSNQRLGRR